MFIEIGEKEWVIFMISHNLIMQTKIISFEFHILQRLLYTNFLYSKF